MVVVILIVIIVVLLCIIWHFGTMLMNAMIDIDTRIDSLEERIDTITNIQIEQIKTSSGGKNNE